MRLFTIILLTLTLLGSAQAADGLITQTSAHGVDITTHRLLDALRHQDMRVIADVDHAAAARDIGLKLGPTHMILFGNPQIGTRLMQCQQTLGIDLPLKMLIWQDARGRTWIGYNDPAWLSARHHLKKACQPVIKKIGRALAAFAEQAAGS